MSNITDALSWRYATKVFDATKKISAADFEELTDVLRLSPSSYGIQPWAFVVVETPELREKLKAAGYNQSQITDASHLIVLCAKTGLDEAFIDRYLAEISAIRGVPTEGLSGYRDMMLGSIGRHNEETLKTWNQKQVYIALGMLLEACALKKIDACPMEGFAPDRVDEILGLTAKGLTATVLCPVGYRSDKDEQGNWKKVRLPKEEVVMKM